MRLRNSWRGMRKHRSSCSYRPLLCILEDRTLPSFITAPNYAAGRNPAAVAVGDFNGDGFSDLAVANNYTDGGITVLLNDGIWPAGPGGAPQGQGPAHAVRHSTPVATPKPPAFVSSAFVAAANRPTPSVVVAAENSPTAPPSPQVIATAPPGRSEAASGPTPVATLRHAPDAVFERWSDPAVGVLDIERWT